ncbi:hypothetical protein FA13DRAFT_173873 [Coprinellus micaceus]|uniref:Uncharacterized protein n=1 Tax=Coprinellus micaceus TaxID=71717 RepID=A0A4Y7SGA6_COPMI|nr:hypothetical protein FA13DRAFT_173873 [Coprinellus micaceus]
MVCSLRWTSPNLNTHANRSAFLPCRNVLLVAVQRRKWVQRTRMRGRMPTMSITPASPATSPFTLHYIRMGLLAVDSDPSSYLDSDEAYERRQEVERAKKNMANDVWSSPDPSKGYAGGNSRTTFLAAPIHTLPAELTPIISPSAVPRTHPMPERGYSPPTIATLAVDE